MDAILAEHAVDITLTKSPLIILLAVVIFLPGIGLILLSIAMIVGSLTGLQEVWAAIFARRGLFQDGA